MVKMSIFGKQERKKKVMVLLGKKGARRLLGSLELEEKDDLAHKIAEFLDEKVKEFNINPKEYSTIILWTIEGKEIKFENPFLGNSLSWIRAKDNKIKRKLNIGI
jgi:hypothetical protein